MRNNHWSVPLLLLATLGGLIILNLVPEQKVGPFDFKQINILADVQKDADEQIDIDSLSITQKTQPKHTKDSINNNKQHREGSLNHEAGDSLNGMVAIEGSDLNEGLMKGDSAVFRSNIIRNEVPEGLVAIEEYGNYEGRIMDKFYSALDSVNHQPVRILYFGDSFIEGDILTQDLREFMQTTYGGEGVGFVDITSITSQYRQTINTSVNGWDSHHANDRKNFEKSLQGVNGKYFIPSSDNCYVEFSCPKKIHESHLARFSESTIYFTPGDNLSISVLVNKEHQQNVYNAPNDLIVNENKVEKVTTLADMTNIRYNIKGGATSRFYGIAMEGKHGICVDNMSLRGSNGKFLADIPESTLASFAKARPYHLVIIQYGLNVASNQVKDYSNYTNRMRHAIQNFRKAYPNAAILLVGTSDRDEKGASGHMQTLQGIKDLVKYQRKLAEEECIAFWDLREAMGGEAGIAKMREQGLAQVDYTHINFKGGKYIAQMLHQVLVNGKENFDVRNNQSR